MRGLPSGTVTLVLGDVESSTERWEASAHNMAAAMQTLHATLDELLATHRGARPLEQGEGDSFVAAFGRAADAVAFAEALQHGSPLPVRIGIHTGDVEVSDGGYSGTTIIRAARLRDAGHGGQVLLSQVTAALVADDIDLDDLGEHHLKGLARAERVWQLPGDFPPLRLDGEAHAPPTRLTTFIGRAVELAALGDLLKEPGCVTITGAGGAGKTRIALELAGLHVRGWFVDLASVEHGDNVAAAVADAVGARVAERSVEAAITAVIRDADALLVLDNCEHLLAACGELATDLLGRCPALTVLATSREPLGLDGEVTYRLPSLSEAEATELFVERARRANPRLELDAPNATAIVEICERLDGMPLAIELAAARMRVFSASQLLEALHDRFRLLTGGARTAMPRQRTLEASVDWSYALLLDAERVLLRRLSVFAGGFTIEAATAVATDDTLQGHHILDLLVQLVEKSLVTADDTGGRFHMLETIRHYAMARLVDAGEGDACRQRHFEYFLALANQRQDPAAWVVAVAVDEANFRRALQFAADLPEPDQLLALAGRLSAFWAGGSRAKEGTDWFALLDQRTQGHGARVRAKVLSRRARLGVSAGNWIAVGEFAREAVGQARASGDERLLMYCILDGSAAIANAFGVDEALLDEAYTIALTLQDEASQSFALGQRGFHLFREGGDFVGAKPLLEQARGLAQRVGLGRWAASLDGFLAMADALQGAGVAGLPRYDQVAETLRQAGEVSVLANLLAITAGLRASIGDDAGTERDLAELDDLAADTYSDQVKFNRQMGYGFVTLARGEFEQTVEHFGRLDLSGSTKGFGAALSTLAAIAEAATGRFEEAEEHLRWTSTRPNSMGPLALFATAIARCEIALAHGRHEQAFETALTCLALTVSDTAMVTRMLLGMLGRACANLGRYEEATRVMAAGSGAPSDVNFFGSAGMWTRLIGDTPERCRAALGEERHATLTAEGATLSREAAVALVHRGRGSRQRPMLGWDSLTPTEAQVAALVGQGVSNKEVAAQLFMSEATVKTHLTRIYTKVGVKNRAQLAAAHRFS
ncbi:MAG TPA: LuxR C-terminal-related transcriptional regulator [Acidimicrobiales bacterium]|nr:LuxR C-terminal-related transcriptional regulator [Acidimicrobiales bacterium]